MTPNERNDAMDSSPLATGDLSTGDRQPGATDRTDLTLSEERMQVATQEREIGRVRATKTVTSETYEDHVQRGVEQADLDREPALETDSGQIETLADGSISIPLFEEQVIVTKRMVVRERVILRKHTVYTDQLVQAELRREQVDITAEGRARITGDIDGATTSA